MVELGEVAVGGAGLDGCGTHLVERLAAGRLAGGLEVVDALRLLRVRLLPRARFGAVAAARLLLALLLALSSLLPALLALLPALLTLGAVLGRRLDGVIAVAVVDAAAVHRQHEQGEQEVFQCRALRLVRALVGKVGRLARNVGDQAVAGGPVDAVAHPYEGVRHLLAAAFLPVARDARQDEQAVRPHRARHG